jgi:predicted GIY-YIG superfamily endonuclease
MCTFLLIIEELRFISELPITFIQECGNINWEKQLKNWDKQWKWNLVKQNNPKLEDWYDTLRGW